MIPATPREEMIRTLEKETPRKGNPRNINEELMGMWRLLEVLKVKAVKNATDLEVKEIDERGYTAEVEKVVMGFLSKVTHPPTHHPPLRPPQLGYPRCG